MKSKIILAFFVLILSLSCSKPERPKLTIAQYATQANTARGVVLKLLAEEDYKRLHAVALAVESARAVSCTTISDECNLYGKILNRIVFATQTGPISDSEKIVIFKMVNEMDAEFRKGQEMIEKQWAEYIKVSNAEASK
jgi:hypothetical protein